MSDPNLRGLMVDDLQHGRRPLGSLGGVAEYATVNGNTVLVGADGVITDLKLKPLAQIDGRFLSGQPSGITRPVTNTGKLVCRFKASEWTAQGLATLADHTGYNADGDVTGVVSRTGHPTLMKLTPGDNSNEGCYASNFTTTFVNKNLGGKFGIWMYVDVQPGYQPGSAPLMSMAVEVSTNSSSTNGMTIYFNINVIKEGWNFVTFVMRNPAAYVVGSGVSEDQPYGCTVTSNGTGADTDIVNNAVARFQFSFSTTHATGFVASATNIYLDSIWTDFETMPQLVMGYDDTEQSVLDYAMPIFEQYGWKGYFTINGGYWDGVAANRIMSDYTNTGDKPIRIAAFNAAGWDAINHGLLHLPGVLTSPKMSELTSAAEIAYEVMANYGVMRSLGLSKGCEFYAAPQNSMSRLTEKVVYGCGFKLQRAARGAFTQVTAWGIPNPNHIGSMGLGGVTAPVCTSVTGGVTSAVSNMTLIANATRMIDIAIAYGATLFAFSHGLETVGDDGTGNSTPADDTKCTESMNRLFLAYAKAKEDAGLIRVCDGFTGFYYGIGR